LAEASGLPTGEVVELLESASLAGLPPYSPDVLLDVIVDEELDLVEVSVDTGIARAQRIDVVEAMTVLATLESVKSIMDEDVPELRSASEKLQLAIRAQLLRSGEIAAPDSPPEAVALLRRAIANTDCVEIDYIDAEGQASHRHLVALGIFVVADRWYLFGLVDGKERHFRLDRMRDVHAVAADDCHSEAEIRLARRSIDRLDPLGLRSSGTPTQLHIQPDQLPMLEALTMGVFDRLGGEEFVVYSFREEWLARLVLALGPGVEGVVTSELIELIRLRAEMLLAFIEETSGGVPYQGGGVPVGDVVCDDQ
jgi:predicted DNA-binding transcriptional regulator YafY